MIKFDKMGREIPDPTPIELPLGYSHPVPLEETIKALVRDQISRISVEKGGESFEEANDFDTGEAQEPYSEYELRDMEGYVSLSDHEVLNTGFQEEVPKPAPEKNGSASLENKPAGHAPADSGVKAAE